MPTGCTTENPEMIVKHRALDMGCVGASQRFPALVRVLGCVALWVCFCLGGICALGAHVFPDPNGDPSLEMAVRSALSMPAGPISSSDLEGLTCLDARGRQITNLAGLEWALNLKELDLNGNAVSDLTPLQGLTQLAILDLEQNQITNLSPLKLLINLNCLTLGKNGVFDYSVLSNLTHLVTLSIRAGGLRDLQVLTNMTGLRSLVLFENSVADISPVTNLTNLASLDLRWNSITNCEALLFWPTNLAILYLGGNALSNAPSFQCLTNLHLLNLEDTQISDLSPLSGLSNVTYLALNRNPITNYSVLSSLTALVNLELRGNSISDISFLTDLSQLAHVDLAYNNITNVSALRRLSRLENLILTGNRTLDYSDLSDLRGLSNLWLQDVGMTNLIVLTNLSNLSGLRYLSIEQNGIRNIPVVEVAKSLTNLNGLAASRNPFGDYSPLSNLTHLASLRLEHNEIGDVAFLTNLTGLKFLGLSQNHISDLSPLTKLTGVEDLYLRRNAISDLSSLTDLPSLKNLDVSFNRLDFSSSSTPDSGVISNLIYRTTGAVACSCGSLSNVTESVQCQKMRITYLPTNQPPRIWTALTTPWFVAVGSVASMPVFVGEDPLPEDPLEARASSSNSQDIYIGDGSSNDVLLSGSNAVRELTVNVVTNATVNIGLTVSDDVGLAGTSSMLVVSLSPLLAKDQLAAGWTNLDGNLEWAFRSASGRLEGDVRNVDLLMTTDLSVYDGDISCFTAWQWASNLTSLFLKGELVTNLDFATNLVNLRKLVLLNTRVSNLSPITNLSNLIELDVDGNPMTAVDGLLSWLPKLVSLSLSGDSISNVCSFGGMTGLTSLRLYGNRLRDISSLAGLTNLIYLDLHHNLLTNITIATNFVSLQGLDVRDNLLDQGPDSAAMATIGALIERGVVVDYRPQRAPPVIYILTNHIVAAGQINTLPFYMTENENPVGDEVQVLANWENPGVVTCSNNFVSSNYTASGLQWYLNVVPAPGHEGQGRVCLLATNDADLGSSEYAMLTVIQPLSITNQVFAGSNVIWRTSGDAQWFGQDIVALEGVPAAQSGYIAPGGISRLEANLQGPGFLTFWWRISSQPYSNRIEFKTSQQTNCISGEVDWQQVRVNLFAGPQTLSWEYVKTDDETDDPYSGRGDAAWVSGVEFVPGSWVGLFKIRTNNQFRLTAHGLPGQAMQIQTSSDLSFWNTMPGVTVSNDLLLAGGGASPFLDLTAGEVRRFYRLAAPPQMAILRMPEGIALSWTGTEMLQSSPTPLGPWTILRAKSPFLVSPEVWGAAGFFRLGTSSP
jgi:internalin A